jgi:putative phage-type endonuclease
VTAVELLPPGEAIPDNEAWHELRRAGITASEIAAVMGISPWESPFSCYWRKVCGWRTDDSDIMSTGRRLEDAIAEWWSEAVGEPQNYQLSYAGLLAHADRPWQIATPDRILYGTCPDCGGSGFDPREDPEYGAMGCRKCQLSGYIGEPVALLECKWIAYSWDGWGEPGTDEIPVYYRAQCLWQLDVMGVDEVHIAALGPGGFRAYGPIVRDEDDLAVMRKAGAEFARRLAEQDPPPLDGHTGTLATLKRLHPSVGEGDVDVSADLAERYRNARAEKKAIEEYIAGCEAEIRALLGSTYARATCGGRTVASRSVFEQERIDVARLRAEQPDIAAAYTTKTTVDRLNPGRVSHD